MMEQSRRGYSSSQWLTYNQIKKLGYYVQAGQKGTGIIYFSPVIRKDKETGDKVKSLIQKYYTVFNLCQTNMPAADIKACDDDFFASQTAFNLSAFNLSLIHDGDRAFYQPSTDHINMPVRSAFISDGEYMATFLHELVHWTGHKTRIQRDCADNYARDRKARAIEELIAEMGSVFLCAHYNVESDVKNHASYVKSWQRDLTSEDVALAIKYATKAFKLIMDTSNGKQAETTLEQAA